MAGLVKPKKYDWRDSNLALFGSDLERQVKKESAMTEPAWEGAGQEVGLQIWRIVQFKVTHWPKEDYGKFYSGDSYIILNTYHPREGSEALAWDLHFWIGKHSTQDEYGTAAYKTVELDTYLDDNPVQHRETQGHESDKFRGYFKKIIIMEGGADTGFRHVTPEEYRPRLLHFSGLKRHVTVQEIPLTRSRVTSNDVYILDLGLKLYQFNGSECSKDERFKAMQFMQELKSERGNAEYEVLDEPDTPDDHEFFTSLTGEDEDDEDEVDEGGIKELYRVSDESGEMKIHKIKDAEISQDDLVSEDVMVLDVGDQCFVWVGKGASWNEKKNGFSYAHKHLMGTRHAFCPVVVLKEGQQNQEFELALAA